MFNLGVHQAPQVLSGQDAFQMGDPQNSLSEVQVDNISCSPFVYQASHLSWSSMTPLHESMLTVDDFLIVHVLGLATL